MVVQRKQCTILTPGVSVEVTPTAGNLFITILINMTHIKNESQSGNNSSGRVELINNVDMQKYVETVRRCKISEPTAMFIAGIRVLGDLYGLVFDGLVLANGGNKDAETVADKIIQDKYGKVSRELDSILYDFLHESIYGNIIKNEINEI